MSLEDVPRELLVRVMALTPTALAALCCVSRRLSARVQAPADQHRPWIWPGQALHRAICDDDARRVRALLGVGPVLSRYWRKARNHQAVHVLALFGAAEPMDCDGALVSHSLSDSQLANLLGVATRLTDRLCVREFGASRANREWFDGWHGCAWFAQLVAHGRLDRLRHIEAWLDADRGPMSLRRLVTGAEIQVAVRHGHLDILQWFNECREVTKAETVYYFPRVPPASQPLAQRMAVKNYKVYGGYVPRFVEMALARGHDAVAMWLAENGFPEPPLDYFALLRVVIK
jgi:hypothetical protein